MQAHARLARVLCVVALAACCCQPAPAQLSAEPPDRDLSSYRSELQRLLEGMERLEDEPESASDLLQSVPGELRVSTRDGAFTIPLQWVRRELGIVADSSSKEERKEQALDTLRTRLRALAEHAEAYEQAQAHPRAETTLHDILSRREFQDSQGQGWAAAIRQRMAEVLMWLLGSALGKIADYPLLGTVFVWSVIALVLIVLVVWLFRLFGRSARSEETAFYDPEVPSHRSWESWLAESRKRAGESAWRDAIRLCYWAAISKLESIGRWPADRARTPREYLRLLPELGEERKRLGELTRGFELAWYAQQPVSEVEFQTALARAQELGCR